MLRLSLPLLAMALAGAATLAPRQERILKPAAPDFPALHAAVLESWKSESYGRCIAQTRDLLAVVSRKRSDAIFAVLPPAPAGYEALPRVVEEEPLNAWAAAFTASVGNVVEQSYVPVSGAGQTLTVKVTSDSPMLAMVSMSLTNPALLGPEAELIQYTAHKGVLSKQGDGYMLQVVIGQDIVEASAPDKDGDFLLGVLSQKVIDALAATLAR